MKRSVLVLLTLALFALVSAPQFAQQGPPALPLMPVPDFFKLPPGINFGEPVAVDVDSKGNVYIADTSNNRIRMVRNASNCVYDAPTSCIIYTIAGPGGTSVASAGAPVFSALPQVAGQTNGQGIKDVGTWMAVTAGAGVASGVRGDVLLALGTVISVA